MIRNYVAPFLREEREREDRAAYYIAIDVKIRRSEQSP